MAQPVESARIASYCPIAPLKNAIRYLLTPIIIYKLISKKTIDRISYERHSHFFVIIDML